MSDKKEIIWTNDKDNKQTAFKVLNETLSGSVLKATLIKQKDLNGNITDNYDVKIGRYRSREHDNFKTYTQTTTYRDKYEMGVYLSRNEFDELINFITEANIIVKENEGKNKYLKFNSDDLAILESLKENPTLFKQLNNNLLEYAKNEFDIRSLKVDKFEEMINNENLKEKNWQDFFEENSHILQVCIPTFYQFLGGKLYARGQDFYGKGSKIPDLAFIDALNSVSFIEIKTHKTDLLSKEPYRTDVYQISKELSGAISQALSQRHEHYSRSNSKDNPKNFYNSPCYIIIGNTSQLDTDEKKKSFDLIRNSLLNINIITFDEILKKLVDLLETLKKVNSKYDLDNYNI